MNSTMRHPRRSRGRAAPARAAARASRATLAVAAAFALILTAAACGKPVAGDAAAETTLPESSTSMTDEMASPTEPAPSSTEPSVDDSTEPTVTEPTEPTEPEPSDGDSDGATVETYVYYVVDTRNEFRLARELRDVPDGDGAAVAALEAMIAGPDDPDYTTAWNPDTAVLSVQVDGDAITVDLSSEARTANVGSPGAAMLVQQLLWTVTDAVGAPEATVQLLIDGEPAGELWGALTWEGPIARADALSTRVVVQIDTPREGAQVTSPVTVTGDAAAFEANVPWRILDENGTEVESGFTMTGDGTNFSPFSFDVELEPGDYTVEIIQDDPSDGEAGPPSTDTRSITVTG